MSLEKVAQAIQENRTFMVTTHVNPEGDAAGSALAMTLALKSLGKEVSLILRDPIPPRLKFLPESGLFQQATPQEAAARRFDAMVVVDCGDLDRVGLFKAGPPPVDLIINIDHHVTNLGFGHLNWIIGDATASGSMVYALIQHLKVPMTQAIAMSLYTTLVTETGAFRYSNTTASTFHLAGELTHYGADPCAIAEAIYGNNSVRRMHLLGRFLDAMKVSEDGQMAWVLLPQSLFDDTGTTVEDTEDFINFPRSLAGVEVAFLLRETNEAGIIKASLRANNEVDVARVATQFGGGGHRKAAGFSMKGTLQEVQAATAKAVAKAISEARQRTV